MDRHPEESLEKDPETEERPMFSFQELIPELRLAVLKEVSLSRKYGILGLLCVCKEWQMFFEKINFETVTVTSDHTDLLQFNQIVQGRRRKLVRTIRLSIPTTENRTDGWNPGDQDAATRFGVCSTLFTETIHTLFSMLSSWEDSHADGLGLELFAASMHCPLLIRNKTPLPLLPRQELKDRLSNYYRDTGRRTLLSEERRVVGTLLELNPLRCRGGPPPEVPVVARFSIEKQEWRVIPPSTLQQLVEKMTGLKKLHHGPVIDICGTVMQRRRDEAYLAFLENAPSTVTSLSLSHDAWPSNIPLLKETKSQLASAAFEASRHLEFVSIMLAVDAADFFIATGIGSAALATPTIWPRLERLQLTSEMLERPKDRLATNQLLILAGKAAIHMPCLRFMQIFDMMPDTQFLFQCQILDDVTILITEAAWEFEPSQEVTASWRQARRHMRHDSRGIDSVWRRIQPELHEWSRKLHVTEILVKDT